MIKPPKENNAERLWRITNSLGKKARKIRATDATTFEMVAIQHKILFKF